MASSLDHHHFRHGKNTLATHASPSPPLPAPPPPRYNTNKDEVEAGSILVALANHHQKRKSDTHSMSIHNLVGK